LAIRLEERPIACTLDDGMPAPMAGTEDTG
jgi:hypothetical protein